MFKLEINIAFSKYYYLVCRKDQFWTNIFQYFLKLLLFINKKPKLDNFVCRQQILLPPRETL